MADLDQVGGKNASLGEMIGGLAEAGIAVPAGFATPAQADSQFLTANGLDRRITERLKLLDSNDVEALAKCGAEVRSWIEAAPFPQAIEDAIRSYYQELLRNTSSNTSFAIRSSATAEDMPDASYAGQRKTFLHYRGVDNVQVEM